MRDVIYVGAVTRYRGARGGGELKGVRQNPESVFGRRAGAKGRRVRLCGGRSTLEIDNQGSTEGER